LADVEVVRETQADVVAANVFAQTRSPMLSHVELKNVVAGAHGDLGEDVEVVQETQADVIAANVVGQTRSPILSHVELKNSVAEVEVVVLVM